ncbi:MAG: NAD(P)H-hydrate dehydratase [Opitutales bacterium]
MHRLPILTCKEAQQYEAAFFNNDLEREEAAMRRAGIELGKHLAQDVYTFIEEEESPDLILLLGKGNNTGDALYAASAFADSWPDCRVSLFCCWNPNSWSDPVFRAFETLQNTAEIFRIIDLNNEDAWENALQKAIESTECPIVLDGIFGMSFRPPLRGFPEALITLINDSDAIRLRVAVDMPSGLSEASANYSTNHFRSDLTYATGILKTLPTYAPCREVGRLRMIDLDFFENTDDSNSDHVLSPKSLLPSARPCNTDKRTFGHVFLIAGSRRMPGALIMATQAAIRSGVGLVTVCAPESICIQASIQLPEAMWVPLPESISGDLDLQAMPVIRKHISRASSLLIGPGMGRSQSTQDLIQSMIEELEDIPLILDADALQQENIEAASASKDNRPGTILTPHAGEMSRISGDLPPRELAALVGGIVVEKGPRTWIHSESDSTLIPFGSPVLARGGSGDILAGLVAGAAAARPDALEHAASYATAIHGRAADRLARTKGEKHIATTDLLEYL